MADQDKISIVLDAVDQAGNALKIVTNEVDQLGKTTELTEKKIARLRATVSLRPDLTGIVSSTSAFKAQQVAAESAEKAIQFNRGSLMELGHVARAGASSILAGISPLQILAFEAPRIVQALAFAGIGFTAIATAAAGAAGAIGIVSESFRTLKASEEEALSGQNLDTQAEQNAERIKVILQKLLDTGRLTEDQFDRLSEILSRGTAGAVTAVQKALLNSGFGADALKALTDFEALNEKVHRETLDNFEQQRLKAKDVYNERIKQIDDLAARTPQIDQSQVATAKNAAGQARDVVIAGIDEAEKKKKEAADLAEIEQKITLNQINQGEVRKGAADAEFNFRAKEYKFLKQVGEISEDEYTRLVIAAEVKRQAGVKAEQERAAQDQEAARQQRRAAVLSDVQASQDAVLQAGTKLTETQFAVANFDPFGKSLTAADDYLKALEDQRAALDAILVSMQRIEEQNPGTFSTEDFKRVSAATKQNAVERVKVERDTEKKKQDIRDASLNSLSDSLGKGAALAKAFGKKGFAAYQALAIAQATIATANSAINAYNSTVGIPYVGPVLAPIAAAAAVAFGAAQIAEIASEKYATGGLVLGPGSGTSDSIPARLSNREFVIRNSIVEQPGAQRFLEEFNARGMAALSFPGGVVAASSPPGRKLASGGIITGGATSNESPASGGLNVHLALLNDRKAKRDFIRRDGMKVVLSELQRRGNLVSL